MPVSKSPNVQPASTLNRAKPPAVVHLPPVVEPTVTIFAPTNSTVTLGAGDATVHLSGWSNKLVAGDGNHTVDGALGNSSVTLGNGNQTVILQGWSNNVQIGNSAPAKVSFVNAGQGNSTVVAGNGTNVINVGGLGDTVTVGNGTNMIFGSAAQVARMTGSPAPHPELLTDNGGGATVTLGHGSSVVFLQGWSNSVSTSGGTAAIQSGSGQDTFHIGGSAGLVFVGGFQLDGGDRIDLSKLSLSAKDLSFHQATMPSGFLGGGLTHDTVMTAFSGAGATNVYLEGTTVTDTAAFVASHIGF